jgi:hypothetical protein
MTDEPKEPTLAELYTLIRSLYGRHQDLSVRIDSVRVLCEAAGVFSHDHFEAMVATLQARGDEGARSALAHLQPERIEWMRRILQAHEGDPQ